MARVNAGMRVKKTAVRKNPKRSGALLRNAGRTAAKPRRPHEFRINHLREDDFKSDGLRRYARYRDLGIKDATHGMAVAHVIRFRGPCDPKVVSKLHTHAADLQLIYELTRSFTSQFAGYGLHTRTAGGVWVEPNNIKYNQR